MKKKSAVEYFVYIVKCADKTFYTGIATDLQRRVAEHNESSKGAKYTSARRPVELVYAETAADRSAAQSREYQVRKMSRALKQRLAKEYKTK